MCYRWLPALQLDLVLTSFSASVALVTAITGLFAMNVMLLPDRVSCCKGQGWCRTPGGTAFSSLASFPACFAWGKQGLECGVVIFLADQLCR